MKASSSTYPSLLRDGVTLRVECGFSSHSIRTKSLLDSWSVFHQDGGPLLRSGSHDLISSEGITRVGLLGAFIPGRPRGEFFVILWLTGLLCGRGGSHIQLSSLLARTLCVLLSPTKEWVLALLLLLALLPLALPWQIGLLRWPRGD